MWTTGDKVPLGDNRNPFLEKSEHLIQNNGDFLNHGQMVAWYFI